MYLQAAKAGTTNGRQSLNASHVNDAGDEDDDEASSSSDDDSDGDDQEELLADTDKVMVYRQPV